MAASSIRSRVLGALAAPVLAAALMAASAIAPAPAFADEPTDGTFNILTSDQTMALAVDEGAGDGAKVKMVPEDADDEAQRFQLTQCDDGTWEIVSALDSDLALDVDGDGAQVWSRTGASNQRFAIFSQGDGSVRIVPASNVVSALTLSDDAVAAASEYGEAELCDDDAVACSDEDGIAVASDEAAIALCDDALSVSNLSISSSAGQSFFLRTANLVGMTYANACVGDKLVYSVTQQVNQLGVNAFVRYTSMQMYDTLPQGLTYVSAKLYSASNVCLASSDGKTTTAGTFSYASSSRKLTFTFSSTYLKSGMAMSGEKYRMEITTKIASIPSTNKFENTGYTKINSTTLTSNKVTTPILTPSLKQGKSVVNSTAKAQVRDSSGALEVHAGDTLHYTLTVDQTVKGAVQQSKSLTDAVPSGLQLVSSSVKVTDGDTASVKVSGSTITVTTGRLVYGDHIAVEYDCKVAAGFEGQQITNVFGSAAPPVINPGPVKYFRDGESEPVYVDKTSTSLTGIYQVDSAATAAAARSDCAGLDGWYLDPECTVKYDPAVNGKAAGKDGFNLYSRNKVELTYAPTANSYFVLHPDRAFYLDAALTQPMTSYAQVLPVKETHWYGDTVTFAAGAAVYYNDLGSRAIVPANGAYRYADGSGSLLTSAKLTANATAYLLWGGSSYDGVYASN